MLANFVAPLPLGAASEIKNPAVTGAVLLTRDRHLLDGRPFPGLVVLTPAEFVQQGGLSGDGGRPG